MPEYFLRFFQAATSHNEMTGKGTSLWANMMFGDPSYKNPNMEPLTKPPFRVLRLTPTTRLKESDNI